MKKIGSYNNLTIREIVVNYHRDTIREISYQRDSRILSER